MNTKGTSGQSLNVVACQKHALKRFHCAVQSADKRGVKTFGFTTDILQCHSDRADKIVEKLL